MTRFHEPTHHGHDAGGNQGVKHNIFNIRPPTSARMFPRVATRHLLPASCPRHQGNVRVITGY